MTKWARSLRTGVEVVMAIRVFCKCRIVRASGSGKQCRVSAHGGCVGGLGAASVPGARPDERDEARGPVAAFGAAPVRERRQDIADHDAVALAVDAVAAPDAVGANGVGRQVFEAGMMELVCADLGSGAGL